MSSAMPASLLAVLKPERNRSTAAAFDGQQQHVRGGSVFGRAMYAAASAAAVAVTASCGSLPVLKPSPTPKHIAVRTPTPTPPAVPSGPFAVVVTNAPRSGTTYDVLIVDTSGPVVARASANLPLIKPNQTLDLPLVSASATQVYYRNGDTDVYALSPDGSTGIVRRLPEGTKAEIAFAASPDDQRIAVVDLTEQADATQNSSRGYVESLSGSTNRVDLFNTRTRMPSAGPSDGTAR
jgi:hypothetical protein